jgi:cytochrome c-type biogenesis protein CcmF
VTVGLSQIYASLGDAEPEGRVGIRLYWKPLVLLMWLGALVMAMGGALALSDRPLRLGVPMRLRARGAARSTASAE